MIEQDIIPIMAILSSMLSILVGFLMLFLEFYPQRKRNLLQALSLKMIDADEKKQEKIRKAIERAKKPDIISFKIDINKFNFGVFIYSVLILIFAISTLMYYMVFNILPDLVFYLVTVLTIVGYLLLIPVVKFSYLETKYVSLMEEEK